MLSYLLLYSLKFSRVSWVGVWPQNFSPVKFWAHDWCNAWLEPWRWKFYLWKFVFEQNLAKPPNIKSLKIRLYDIYKIAFLIFITCAPSLIGHFTTLSIACAWVKLELEHCDLIWVVLVCHNEYSYKGKWRLTPKCCTLVLLGLVNCIEKFGSSIVTYTRLLYPFLRVCHACMPACS